MSEDEIQELRALLAMWIAEQPLVDRLAQRLRELFTKFYFAHGVIRRRR